MDSYTVGDFLVCIFLFIHSIDYPVFLTSIPSIFSDIYQESPGIAGLHYLALGIGLIAGAQINAQFLDRIYIHLKNKNGGVGEPEFRLRKSRSHFLYQVTDRSNLQ